jgi:hypothetical protein
LEDPRETVVLSKIMRRESFYKAKALRIEKDLIFAKEQIDELEARIQNLTQQESESSSQKEKDFKKSNQQIEDLTKRLQEEAILFKEREKELVTEIKKFKADQAETKQSQFSQEQITGYEKLLTEIQGTVNEKEQEVIIYKARLDLLEKRLKQQTPFADLNLNDIDEHGPSSHTRQKMAVSYIEHALILSEEGCLIRGECVVENVGTQKLDTPLICFRINPLDVVTFKGKIQVWGTNEDLAVGGIDPIWSIIQNDWANEAKEREEIWLAPDRPIYLRPGEKLRVPDLQLSINRKFCKHVTIEGFIYFKNADYKVRMVNPIIINF